MNIALWIIAGLLAVAFLASGALKLIQPKEKLPASWGWVKDFSAGSIKAIGHRLTQRGVWPCHGRPAEGRTRSLHSPSSARMRRLGLAAVVLVAS